MFYLLGFKDVPAPLGFENWLTFWLLLVLSLLNAVLMLFVGYKFLQVLQLSGYKHRDYFAWNKSTKFKDWGRLIVLSFLSSAALLVTNVLLEQFFVYKILTYIGLIFYFLFCSVYIVNVYNAPQKTPLKYTNRMSRLCVVLFVLVFAFSLFVLMLSSKFVPIFEFGAVGLTPMLLPLLIVLAHFILLPFEMLNSRRYVKLAINKINSRKDLTVIGITGSFGKTTVKNILATMLAEKYKVCASPHSYNTPLGLSKTILNNLKEDDEVLIAEMGAKHTGDIAYLAKMVKPKIGIITGIGNQHLLTFGSIENLKNTKYELIENLCEDGVAYFNLDSKPNSELYDKTKIVKYATTVAQADEKCNVCNIQVSERGSSFILNIDGKSVSCETIMLGEHNISNILLCAQVAYHLGVSLEQIQMAITKLVPSPHRLAIVPSGNSLVVIDDAYNGSVEGYKAALATLKQFKTKKIIITPGLVELGKEEFNSNFEFGKDMASVCDYVIINGVINYDAISSGLEFGGFNKENILRAGSLKQAIEVLNSVAKSGDVVLFENDLPDNYT